MIAAITPGQLRRVQRRAHLFGAVVLFAYVYLPLGTQLEDVVRFAVFPVLAVTGIAMWQAARIRRALKSIRPEGRKGGLPDATPRNG